jgi:hypothetical protein
VYEGCRCRLATDLLHDSPGSHPEVESEIDGAKNTFKEERSQSYQGNWIRIATDAQSGKSSNTAVIRDSFLF